MWRVWEDLDADSESVLTPITIKKASLDFTVMSYNILAQDLLELNQHLYAHCPLEVQQWSYRCNLLLNEIEKWAPDVSQIRVFSYVSDVVQQLIVFVCSCPSVCRFCVCRRFRRTTTMNTCILSFLRWVEQLRRPRWAVLVDDVASKISYILCSCFPPGYTCVYQRRTGTKTDGCAVCYQGSRFAEAAVSKLEFFRPETGLLDRHNVGIVLLLRPLVTTEAEVKKAGPSLCVANTHLLFNPRRGDVKLAQLAIMLAEIDAVIKYCKARGEHCNVVFCGDFNSVPHLPLYQFITTGELSYQGLPTWMVRKQNGRTIVFNLSVDHPPADPCVCACVLCPTDFGPRGPVL